MSATKGDELKKPVDAYLPDSRSSAFGLNDISDQYNRINKYSLAEYVPEKVATQYEVARNIYLYAFNVYRFYIVSQHQALVALEFAIKERFGKSAITKYGKEIKKGRGLAACLHYLFDKGYVVNEDFPAWQNRRRTDAEWKYEMQKLEEMEAKGLNEIEVNFDDIDYEKHSLEYDYLEVLCETMPFFRNLHAHGSTTLYPNVLITFENVSTIINKIYIPEKS